MKTLKTHIVVACTWENPKTIPKNFLPLITSSGGSTGHPFLCWPTSLNKHIEAKRLSKDYGRQITVVCFLTLDGDSYSRDFPDKP